MLHLPTDESLIALGDIRQALADRASLAIPPAVMDRIKAAQAVVDKVVAKGAPAYGINTGFGLLAHTRIPDARLTELQRNIVLSHAAGVGDPLDDEVVHLILQLKIIGLAQGRSGVRPLLIEALDRLLAAKIYPLIPSKGSVGASGDLAPLAHMSALLLGVGQARHDGKVLLAKEALALCGLAPLDLAPKEGLALLNGTQVSTALAVRNLFAFERVFAAAIVAGALSVDAAMGSDTPFDAKIHAARRLKGQQRVAASLRRLLSGSQIRQSHVECDRVQDPYCLRCQPQVMGSCLDLMDFAAGQLEIELNAATDNPLIFVEDSTILSGGNFHAEPVAHAADVMALSIAEVGSISERRIALLVDPHMSRLPPFLVQDSGVNSGFMIAQVTAAALASENKSLAHPSSVDSLPTSANQEDHVSMATYGSRRLGSMVENTCTIIAIELLAAAQGIELHKAPAKTSPLLEEAYALIRSKVPPYTQDRFFAPDIDAISALIDEGAFTAFAEELLPSFAR